MLIKVTVDYGDEIFVNENHILIVKLGKYNRDVECWRVETGDNVMFLPTDKNEPFKTWLDFQIGGDAWQRNADWRKSMLEADIATRKMSDIIANMEVGLKG